MRMALAAVLMWSACGEGTSWPTIAGWHGDPRYWRAENDEIIGSTDGAPPITQNTFLTRLSSDADFVLDLEFKIRNGNSGIQFRSEELPDYVVRGYQADVSDAADGHLGILYEERGRGFLGAMMIDGVYDHVDLSGWNHYQITADGPHLVLVVNGFTTVDYTETDATARRDGRVALQLHVGAPMEVRYRNIEIRPLP